MECTRISYNNEPDICVTRVLEAHKSGIICQECKKEMSIGEQYRYGYCSYDGEGYKSIVCLSCISAIEVFFDSGWMVGHVWDDIYDHLSGCSIDEMSFDSLSKLLPEALEKVTDFIEKSWSEE